MKKTTSKKTITLKNKKNVNLQEDFNRAITETLYDFGVISTNKKGKIKSWNAGAEKLFGYKTKEAIGKNCSILFILEDRQKKIPEKELFHALKKKRTMDERYLRRKNGTLFLASGIVFPIENEKKVHTGYTKIISDVSEQREFEKRRDDFISTATHEIRTPITTMKLFADIVKNKTKRMDSTSLNDSVIGLNDQIDRLIALTDYLLDVSKIQRGKLTLKKTFFNIDDLIEIVVLAMAFTSSKHVLIKKSNVTEKVFGDKDRISQVITNLISNAIKYSPKGGEVIIKSIQEKNGIKVSVQDFGVGISQSEQHKIFTRFFRADIARKNNISGIGLGLYIANKIIIGHHGKMDMKSVKGKGSTFSFTLPAKP